MIRVLLTFEVPEAVEMSVQQLEIYGSSPQEQSLEEQRYGFGDLWNVDNN